MRDGSQGGKPNTADQKVGGKRVAWGKVDDQPQPAAKSGDKDKDEQITRRVLSKTLKEQGHTPEEVKAKLDEIFPPKPLSDEEKLQDVQERVEKAQRQYKHECTMHNNMHTSAVKRARELLEYRKAIGAQRDKAQQAKEHMERIQEEHDRLHAASAVAPPAQPAQSLDGIFTKVLAQSKLLDKLDSEEARRLKDLCIQTHKQLLQDAAAAADASTAAPAAVNAGAVPPATAAASGSATPARAATTPAEASGSAAAAGGMVAMDSAEEWSPGAVGQRQQPAIILAALPAPPSLSESQPMDDSRIKNARLREEPAASVSTSNTNQPEESEKKRFMLSSADDDELPDDVVLAEATNWGASIADCRVYGGVQQQAQQQQASDGFGSFAGPAGGQSLS